MLHVAVAYSTKCGGSATRLSALPGAYSQLNFVMPTLFVPRPLRCAVLCSSVQVSQLWKDVVTKLGAEYPDVELSHMYIDNAAMQLIRNPKYFDVIVTGKGFVSF
jgi:hypothetical protein